MLPKETVPSPANGIPLTNSGTSRPSSLKLKIFKDLKPDGQQRRALQKILTLPFSVIVEGPGAAKRDLVLAYAVLHFLRQQKRLLILGPDTVALEVTLEAILPMLERGGIDRPFIRLFGDRQSAFYEQYPELSPWVEQEQLAAEIAELERQLHTPERRKLEEARAVLPGLDQLQALVEQLERQDNTVAKFQGALTEARQAYEAKQQELQKAQADLEEVRRRSNSWWHGLKRTVKPPPFPYERVVEGAEFHLEGVQKALEKGHRQAQEIQYQLQKAVQERTEIQNQLKASTRSMREQPYNAELKVLLQGLDPFHLQSVKTGLYAHIRGLRQAVGEVSGVDLKARLEALRRQEPPAGGVDPVRLVVATPAQSATLPAVDHLFVLDALRTIHPQQVISWLRRHQRVTLMGGGDLLEWFR